ncbi:hypothetical protein JCM8547_003174 [Rhodosporidiobolus lusitaniae]
MSLNNFTPVLPVGSLILVTGVNGLIGSHIANEALKLGYRVRGVVRAKNKIAGLKKRWDEQFPGQFEVAVVPDLQVEGAYDDAIKGVSGFAHVSAISGDWTTDLSAAVSTVKNLEFRALEAAAKTPSVKRFVLTSSIVATDGAAAGDGSKLDIPRQIKQDTWYEEGLELAKKEGELQVMAVYASSKMLGEKAAWEWVKEHKPSFDFYVVSPAFTIGEVLDASQHGSTAGWFQTLYHSSPTPFIKNVEALYWISTTDIALLHLGALLLPSSTLPPQRIFGTAASTNPNEWLAVFRELKPGKEFLPDFPGKKVDRATYDTEGAVTILKAFGQEQGFKSLKQAISENLPK